MTISDFLAIFANVLAFSALVWGAVNFFLSKQKEKEIELLKSDLILFRDRISPIHEKRLDAITSTWEKLQTAIGEIVDLSCPLQTYPDLNRYRTAELEEFLQKSRLSQVQREDLRTAQDKNKFYQEKIFFYQFDDAADKFNQFSNNYRIYRFYFSKELSGKISNLCKLSREALLDVEVGHEAQDHKMIRGAYEKMTVQADPLVQEIEDMIRDLYDPKEIVQK